MGNGGNDYLEGGTGHDTYITGNGDTIFDKDGQGEVELSGFTLSGGTLIAGTSNRYKGTHEEIYTLNADNSLNVLSGSESIRILNFNKDAKDLGIDLNDKNNKEILLFVGDAEVGEGGVMTFEFGINQELNEDLSFNVRTLLDGSADGYDFSEISNGIATISAGKTIGTFEVQTLPDETYEADETFSLEATGEYAYNGDDLKSIEFLTRGTGTIKNDDTDSPKDITVFFGDGQAVEGGSAEFTFGIPFALKEDLFFDVKTVITAGDTAEGGDFESVSSAQVKIAAGSTSGTYSVVTNADADSDDETFTLAATGSYSYAGDDLGSLSFHNDGTGFILEGEPAPEPEPEPEPVNTAGTPFDDVRMTEHPATKRGEHPATWKEIFSVNRF